MLQTLIPYIKEYLNKGYDINTIRGHLIKSGYSAENVDQAISTIYTGKRDNPHKLLVLPAIFICLGLVLLISALFILKPNSPKTLLDIEIESLSKSVLNPGDNLEFNVNLLNIGSDKRYDILLLHEIINPNTNKVLTFKQETHGIETKSSKKTQIKIPEDAPEGDYILKSTADYDGKKASALLNFQIKSEKGEEECPDSCDDNDPCTEDFCSDETNYLCEHKETKPCCGNQLCEENENYIVCPSDCKDEEKNATLNNSNPEIPALSPVRKSDIKKKIDEIKEISLANVEEAASQCRDLKKQIYIDRCFSAIAYHSNKNALCEQIKDIDNKDACLMHFALNNNEFSVCDSVVNERIKSSCILLKKKI